MGYNSLQKEGCVGMGAVPNGQSGHTGSSCPAPGRLRPCNKGCVGMGAVPKGQSGHTGSSCPAPGRLRPCNMEGLEFFTASSVNVEHTYLWDPNGILEDNYWQLTPFPLFDIT